MNTVSFSFVSGDLILLCHVFFFFFWDKREKENERIEDGEEEGGSCGVRVDEGMNRLIGKKCGREGRRRDGRCLIGWISRRMTHPNRIAPNCRFEGRSLVIWWSERESSEITENITVLRSMLFSKKEREILQKDTRKV